MLVRFLAHWLKTNAETVERFLKTHYKAHVTSLVSAAAADASSSHYSVTVKLVDLHHHQPTK